MKEIDCLLALAENKIPAALLPNQPPNQYTSGEPEWYSFEYYIWDCGEKIRLLLAANRKYKLNEQQINRILSIAKNANAQRGRQSFMALLAYKRYQFLSDEIVTQINDPNVEGHVIDTILKMQAPQYVTVIKPFMDHEYAWIRNKAKKYISKFDNNV
jgi:hypothetical protein